MKSGKQHSLSAQQEQVLKHVARYRLSFTEIIDHLFFRERSSRKTLTALCDGKSPYLQTVGGFQGRRKAYVLTKLGSKVVTGSVERSKAPNDTNINLLAFCCLSGKKRIRLEQSEITEFFGEPIPGRHLVMQCSGSYCLHSVYVPGASTKDLTILSKVEERFEELADCSASSWTPEPTEWLNTGKLRVTAIVQTAEKSQRVGQALQKRLSPIEHSAIHHCSVVATNSNRLEELLRGLRYSSN